MTNQSNNNPALANGKQPLIDEGHGCLRDCVETAMQSYFDQLDGQTASNVYDMVLQEVEAPLMTMIMKYTRDNQTKAAKVLNINRGTLRKKLKRYGLL